MAATSAGVRTSGIRDGRLARTTCSRLATSRPSTSLNRNSSALKAWFCVEALTCPRVARLDRKLVISPVPISLGGLMPWKARKRLIHHT
jgi:hypothetical protein